MKIQEIINQVKVTVPNLTVEASAETIKDRYAKGEQPSEDLIDSIDKYIIRSCFTMQPTRPTEEQKYQLNKLKEELRWLKNHIIQSYTGVFVLIRFGYAFTVDIDGGRRDPDLWLNIKIDVLAEQEVNNENV